MQKVYSVSRPQIQSSLSDLLDQQLVFIEKPELFLKALECYGTTTFDIVDALLWAYHVIEKHVVLTFDEKLQKYISKTTLSPE